MIVQRFGLDGLPVTLKAIGGTLGCTRECVRKVEVRALESSSGAAFIVHGKTRKRGFPLQQGLKLYWIIQSFYVLFLL